MDADRFDDVTRAVVRGLSRRAALRLLGGGLAAGWAGLRASGRSAHAARNQPAGTPCTRASECASFHCVDDVCCATPCFGQCETCNVDGNAGTCLPVSGPPIGNRPACPGTGLCQATCDGQEPASCAAFPGLDVVCEASGCADGWQTTFGCGGDGTCHPTTTSCGPFVCNAEGTACLTSCDTNDNCVGAAHCAGGVCQGDKGLGEPCASADECQHGFCANGVCCNAACDEACRACDVPGNAGFCAPALDGTDCGEDGRCCDGACVDIQLDVEHCGDCDAGCGGGQVCAAGMCACPSGTAVCGGACVPDCPAGDTLDPTTCLCEDEPVGCAGGGTPCGAGDLCCPAGEDCAEVVTTVSPGGEVTVNVCCAAEQEGCPTFDAAVGITADCCGQDASCNRFPIAFPEGGAELGICCPATVEACQLLAPPDGDFGLTCCGSGESCVTTTIGTPLGDAEVGVCCPPAQTTCLVTNTDGRATDFECCAADEECTSFSLGILSAEVGCCPPGVAGCMVGPVEDAASLQPTCCAPGEVCAAVPTGFFTNDLACCPPDDICTVLGAVRCCADGTECAVQGADPSQATCCPTERLCFFSSIGANFCCPEGTSCNEVDSLCE